MPKDTDSDEGDDDFFSELLGQKPSQEDNSEHFAIVEREIAIARQSGDHKRVVQLLQVGVTVPQCWFPCHFFFSGEP